MAKLNTCDNPQQYDMIVVGSGNGACAFLRQYLSRSSTSKILVLEEGDNFFETSDITHQRNWTQSYAEGNIFKLHIAQTPEKIPILSGRACTMGGGGSINYTMIFESSEWLQHHLSHDQDYWDAQKKELANAFDRPDPSTQLTPVAQHVKTELETCEFSINTCEEGHLPVYVDGDDKQIHIFPTQFNEFGQRVHSGVSLVKWYENERLDFMTQRSVIQLHLSPTDEPTNGDTNAQQQCTAITVRNGATGQFETYSLAPQAKVVLCAGAATPQLLYEHREALNNMAIGQHVNDHIVLPFGIYLLSPALVVTLKDQYVSLFATTEEHSEKASEKASADNLSEPVQSNPVVCNFDFFSGSLEVLLYLVSHLFLAFWVPNCVKFWMIRRPFLFQILKQVTRFFVGLFNFLVNVLWSILHPLAMGKNKWNLISTIVKFNIAREGYYDSSFEQHRFRRTEQKRYPIILRCFEERSPDTDPDFLIAKEAIAKQLPLMEKLGNKPNPCIQCLIRLLTRMPYKLEQIDGYIRHYSRHDLLTEQHLSGGCIFGQALDLGLESPQDTGKVRGSQNIYVADLSASPLPRVSPQMTAYLIGHHVATQLTTSNHHF